MNSFSKIISLEILDKDFDFSLGVGDPYRIVQLVLQLRQPPNYSIQDSEVHLNEWDRRVVNLIRNVSGTFTGRG